MRRWQRPVDAEDRGAGVGKDEACKRALSMLALNSSQEELLWSLGNNTGCKAGQLENLEAGEWWRAGHGWCVLNLIPTVAGCHIMRGFTRRDTRDCPDLPLDNWPS